MIVLTRCPVRVSFFGGGTDFPDYFEDHPGAVLGSAINQYCIPLFPPSRHVSVTTFACPIRNSSWCVQPMT